MFLKSYVSQFDHVCSGSSPSAWETTLGRRGTNVLGRQVEICVLGFWIRLSGQWSFSCVWAKGWRHLQAASTWPIYQPPTCCSFCGCSPLLGCICRHLGMGGRWSRGARPCGFHPEGCQSRRFDMLDPWLVGILWARQIRCGAGACSSAWPYRQHMRGLLSHGFALQSCDLCSWSRAPWKVQSVSSWMLCWANKCQRPHYREHNFLRICSKNNLSNAYRIYGNSHWLTPLRQAARLTPPRSQRLRYNA